MSQVIAKSKLIFAFNLIDPVICLTKRIWKWLHSHKGGRSQRQAEQNDGQEEHKKRELFKMIEQTKMIFILLLPQNLLMTPDKLPKNSCSNVDTNYIHFILGLHLPKSVCLIFKSRIGLGQIFNLFAPVHLA